MTGTPCNDKMLLSLPKQALFSLHGGFKMKKIIAITLLLVLLLSFAGFAQDATKKDSKTKLSVELENAHYLVRLYTLLFSRSDATPRTRYLMEYWRKECTRLMIKAGQYKMHK